jgi:hypothetical protein
MKKTNLSSLLSILFLLAFVSNFSFAQSAVAGQIFSKDEADKLFGPVHQFVKMPISNFKTLLNGCNDRMMFKFAGTDLHILNGKRAQLFCTSGFAKNFSVKDTMKYYSTSVIKELLSKGQGSSVIIERREKVMSITVGDYTMERANLCPPDCPTGPVE